MNPRVLRRYIILMGMALLLVGSVAGLVVAWNDRPPGDAEVELGGLRLEDGKLGEALAYYDQALRVSPGHPGARMGRILVLIQAGRPQQAEAELDDLISDLLVILGATPQGQEGDPVLRDLLAVAYANRGIIRDRHARHEDALEDYLQSLRIDAEAVEGPGWIEHLLYYDQKPSAVADRARFLHEELAKPPEDRARLTIPEVDATQRPHKP